MTRLSLLKEALSDLPWLLRRGPGLLRMIRDRRPDVVFYAQRPFHRQWIASTVREARRRLDCLVVVDRRGAPDPADDVLSVPRSCLPLLSAPVFVTAVSGGVHPLLARAFPVRVHMPHSLVSLHMAYPHGAFDAFDTVFACGEHHALETAALDRLAGRPPRRAPVVGYGKMDLLLEEARALPPRPPGGLPHVLLAPSWGPRNILNTVGEALVDGMIADGLRVTLRPHPSLAVDSAPLLERLRQRHAGAPFEIEDGSRGMRSLHEADVLISDYSGVAYEFAFLRERPVLFVDVPVKALNPGWAGLGLEPMELALRDRVGTVAPADAEECRRALRRLLDRPGDFRDAIRRERDRHCARPGDCGRAAAAEIESLVRSARS